ncbi:Glycosyltransferase involved in cell wall bisynthesis [Austwickia chelonae]|uniref:D-inositol 3-phosphate glycosyltransferase n=1 Tax=Austwickia chelonae NBRC 105200 TaxID=1184607 RepID=K6VN49_9MICO|nr:glycosyltransferase [Austwickia chelonae]GAB78144.1 putative glycosyltransferase [Austwickia chelonae NBRC 105200]SEV97550.1 Glycosyltransferase involved in cell wall bisynthesis [Austwickia chelonae]
MKILVLGRGVPDPRQPLLGIFEFQQAKALAAAGHQVVYGALDIRFVQHRRPWGVRHREVEGIPVVEVSLPLGRLQYRWGYRWVAASWELLYRTAVRAHGAPDLVHSHFIGWSAAAARMRHRHGYHLVVTEHTSGLMADQVEPTMLEGARIAYSGADAVITVSPGLQDRVAALTGRDSVYIPNLVDAENFTRLRWREHSPRRIVTVGNLIPRKRVDALIEALASSSLDDVRLSVIGRGPQREEWTAKAAQLGMADRVSFEGSLSHAEIAEHFASADLFALVSRAETFGVVLIEAMAAGLPVLSTRSGGPEGFVTEDTGVLTGHDVPQIAAGLEEAFRRGWDREAIRSYAVDHHSPQVIATRLSEVYEQVISGRTA